MHRTRIRPAATVLLAVTALLSGAGALPSQSTLIDINLNPGPPEADSNPERFVSIGADLWFTAEDSANGRELWRSDGVAGGTGTLRVTDIHPGPGDANPRYMTLFQNALYFAATDGVHGEELWRLPLGSSGATPQRVTDIAPGAAGSTPRELTVAGSTLFFVATNATIGAELYAVDAATPGSSRLVKDIQTGPNFTGPVHLTPFGTQLLFSAYESSRGREPWISDGTTAGTVRLRDVNPRSADSSPSDFVVSSGRAWFLATTAANGREVWTTDGTSNGTTLFLDVVPGSASSDPAELIVVRNLFSSRLVFVATTPTNGRELFYTSTGTASVNVLDLRRGSLSSNPSELTPYGSQVAFASENSQGDALLHVFDPIFTGFTTISFDVLGALPPSIDQIEATGVQLYCRVGTGAILTSDGTQAGSSLLSFSQNGGQLAALPGGRAAFRLNFSAWGIEPVVTDGQSFELLADVNPGVGTLDSSPAEFTALPPDVLDGSAVVATANDGVHGRELVTLVGSTGAQTVIDIRPGPDSSELQQLTRIGDEVWFLANDGTHGFELWRTRGDAASTSLVLDFAPGAADSDIEHLLAYGDRACFVVNDGSNVDFWITDGTPAGTSMLANVFNVPAPLLTVEALEIDGELLAIVSSWLGNPLPPVTLVQTGGTPATTTLHALPVQAHPNGLAEVGGKLIFNQPFAGFGTSTNQIQAFDPQTGAVTALHQSTITAYSTGRATGGRYHFLGQHPSLGGEPWLTLGTPASTRAFVDVAPGAPSSVPNSGGLSPTTADTAVADGIWFCELDDGVNGVELWRSDGTSSRTWRVSQIGAGSTGGSIEELAPVGSGRDVLFAGDGELWTADDRAGSARLIQDLRPGSDRSNPGYFTTSGGWVYFSAQDGVHGREAWALPLTALGAPNLQIFGKACSNQSGALLSTFGQPRLGAGDFGAVVGPLQANTPTALRFGIAASHVALPGGCTMHTPEIVSIGLLADARGFARATVPIPNDRNLLGGVLYAQGAFGEAGGPLFGGLGLSEGLQLVIGR